MAKSQGYRAWRAHVSKIRHDRKIGAYLHLWASYWRYWKNAKFRALPDFRYRQVYLCPIKAGGQHWHIGRPGKWTA